MSGILLRFLELVVGVIVQLFEGFMSQPFFHSMVVGLAGLCVYIGVQPAPVTPPQEPRVLLAAERLFKGHWQVLWVRHVGPLTDMTGSATSEPKDVELVLKPMEPGPRERLVVGASHKGIDEFQVLVPGDVVTFAHTAESQEIFPLMYIPPPANNLRVQEIELVK